MTGAEKARERGPYSDNHHITVARTDRAEETVTGEDQDP